MAINSLYGFFYVAGSRDFPSNMELNANFGFNDGESTPIFHYSINDVEKSLHQPRLLEHDSLFNPNTRRDNFLVESQLNEDLASVDVNAAQWEKVFQVMEYLYDNQAGANIAPSDTNLYNSAADEALSDPSNVSTYVDTYISKSLELNGGLAGRLSNVVFTMNINDISVRCTIYFSADDFVEDESNARIYVYQYVDSTPDTFIDNTEFDNNIMETVFNVLKEGQYNRKDTIVIEHVTDSGTVDEQFFIFSSYTPSYSMTDLQKKVYVKDYLRDKYASDYLLSHYPSLFSNDEIIIIPAYSNTSNMPDNSEISAHPVDFGTIRSEMLNRGFEFDPTDDSYKTTELFYVGSMSEGSTVYPYPFIAVDNSPFDAGKPVTTRFPDYGPKNTNELTGTDSEVFQYLILFSLGYIFEDYSSFLTELADDYSMEAHEDTDGDLEYVSFFYKNVTWKVLSPKV